ncbi:hypothetical protein [Priestia filamentosa]|uniref:hypothetical protein n=1 Tax=Priestia filamentosa TaxID=1402861 RepID=UPI000E731F8E|nr:hypothetical protein [Priestia filamentosa]RJS63023.1 hypothetical protein CJ485_24105 [Priestia filamentosa]
MEYTFELSEDGFYIPRLNNEFKLVELVFEDMASFGEAIFKDFMENVITEKSEREEISGNICSLEILKEYTIISTEFVDSGVSNELKVDTDEMFKLINEWVEKNDL